MDTPEDGGESLNPLFERLRFITVEGE